MYIFKMDVHGLTMLSEDLSALWERLSMVSEGLSMLSEGLSMVSEGLSMVSAQHSTEVTSAPAWVFSPLLETKKALLI